MAINPEKTRIWDRTTLNDGDLFDDEFDRLYANISELSTSYSQLLERVNVLEKGARKLGEKFWLDDYIVPSAEFPALCLSESDMVLSSPKWPELVPYLYAKPLRFCRSGFNLNTFRVVNWAVSGETATLTFPSPVTVSVTAGAGSNQFPASSTTGIEPGMYNVGGGSSISNFTYYVTAVDHSSKLITLDRPYEFNDGTGNKKFNFIEDLMLSAMAEDRRISGGGSSLRTITVPENLGNVPPGDYSITGLSTGNRTISFECPGASDGSGVVDGVVEFYPARIAGSTGTVRHFASQGRALVTPGDEFGEIFGNLRRRDRTQGHRHNVAGRVWVDVSGQYYHQHVSSGGQWARNNYFYIKDPYTDGRNGPPRTGRTTSPRLEGAFAYIWGGTYNS